MSSFVGLAVRLIVVAINSNSSAHLPSVNAFRVALCGIIMAVPGLTFTLAITELANGSLVSGASRLLSGFTTVLQLGFGLVVGDRIAHFIPYGSDVLQPTVPMPLWAYAVALPFVVWTFMIVLNSPRYPLAIFMTVLATFGGVFSTIFVSEYMGREMGALIGSLTTGIISQWFSRISNHPSIIISACAILMLVPGSFSIYSINAIISKDIASSVNFLFNMFMVCFIVEVYILQVAMALTIGLMTAVLFLPSRRKLSL